MADSKITSPATIALVNVNDSPAQTWNYLRINDIAFDVPAPQAGRTGAAFNRLPKLFSAIEDGLGAEATRWTERMADGAAYVEVPARTRRDEPVVVAVTDDEPFKDTGVMVREGASVRIIVSTSSRQEATSTVATTAAALRVLAERGAKVEIVQIVASGEGRQHLEAIGVEAADDARVSIRQYALGGAKVALGIAANLAGKSSRIDLTCRYVAGGSELLDINHVVRMRGRDTRSEIQSTGILGDSARKTMRETIDLIHGAKGAKGNEAETVLVTGDGVTNKTLPSILCDEEDVQGNHGATIGSLSPEQIDYLKARGLSEDDIDTLFSRALFDDALNHAEVASARTAVIARGTHVLGDAFEDEALSFSPAEAAGDAEDNTDASSNE